MERCPHGGHVASVAWMLAISQRRIHDCPSLPGLITSSRAAVSCTSVALVAPPFSDAASVLWPRLLRQDGVCLAHSHDLLTPFTFGAQRRPRAFGPSQRKNRNKKARCPSAISNLSCICQEHNRNWKGNASVLASTLWLLRGEKRHLTSVTFPKTKKRYL